LESTALAVIIKICFVVLAIVVGGIATTLYLTGGIIFWQQYTTE